MSVFILNSSMYDERKVTYQIIDDDNVKGKVIAKDVKVFKERKYFDLYVEHILPGLLEHVRDLLSTQNPIESKKTNQRMDQYLMDNGLIFAGSKFWKEFQNHNINLIN